jgi:hypothetical protein
MAKRKSPIQETPVSLDECLASIIIDAKRQLGDDKVFTGRESEARLVGLYLPALCLRYLYQCNIMPLSRMEQITGIQESCKSAFLYEKYRWIRCCGGKGYHIENESKDSDSLRMSMLNYDYNAVDLFISESLEEWQQYVSYLTGSNTIKAALLGTKERPGPGKTIPIGLGVDSLTAKASREIQDKMADSGYADRVHPIDALKISSYLKYFPQRLVGWPFWFGCINHLKPQKTGVGAIDYHTPGGYSVKFQETFETRLARIADIDSGDNGVLIKFVTQKNSLGPGRKTIQAAFRWFFDPDTGKQRSYWDWHSATIDLLDKGLKTGALRSACHDIVDIRTKTSGGKKVWSKTLDIPESDPVPYSVAGKMLEDRTDLLGPLHKVLGVRNYTVFKTGVDYSQQLKEAIIAVELAEGYGAEYRDGEEIVDDASATAAPVADIDD